MSEKNMHFTFNINDGKTTKAIHQEQIEAYAAFYGLDVVAKERYSALFVVNLMLLEVANGVDPNQVIDEIKALEENGRESYTKEASEFRGAFLKGLWHKHFMPGLPSVMANNILNHLGKNGLSNLVEEIFDPNKSSVCTKEMIDELSYRVVEESIKKRGENKMLTGEWIVYAKEPGGNYYLGIWRHDAGDENIAKAIKTTCVPQFPFLSKYFS